MRVSGRPAGEPGGGVAAGLLEHPAADLQHQARFLGDRQEFGRRDRADAGQVPAQQRFHRADLVAAEVDHGLVDEPQLLLGDRAAQAGLERRAARGEFRHRAVEERDGFAARALGVVHREVGVAQQLVDAGAVVGPHRDADRRRDRDLVRVHGGRHGEFLEDAVRDHRGIGARRDLAEVDDELVATLAREHAAVLPARRLALHDAVGAAHRGGEARRDVLQQLVADRVAERVVDALEVVEVDEQHGGAVRLARCASQVRGHGRAEVLAVGEPGQRVEIGEAVHVRLGEALAGERLRELADLVRVERLLHEEQPVGGRDVGEQRAGVAIGGGGADDDVDVRVDAADLARGRQVVRGRRHLQVEEHGVEARAAARLAQHGGGGLAGVVRELRREARRPAPARRGRRRASPARSRRRGRGWPPAWGRAGVMPGGRAAVWTERWDSGITMRRCPSATGPTGARVVLQGMRWRAAAERGLSHKGTRVRRP